MKENSEIVSIFAPDTYSNKNRFQAVCEFDINLTA